MKTGLIYIIKCKDLNIKKCYVGSTTNLNSRIQSHKNSCNNKNSRNHNNNQYIFIRNNGGFDNFYFEILHDKIKFNHRKELNKIERYHIEDIGIDLTLNTNKPMRTDKEIKKLRYVNIKGRIMLV